MGHRTLTSYDAFQFLPKTVTDAAGLTMQATYDYRVLQPKKIMDANGNQTLFAFSPMGLLQSTMIAMIKTDAHQSTSPFSHLR